MLIESIRETEGKEMHESLQNISTEAKGNLEKGRERGDFMSERFATRAEAEENQYPW